MPLSRSVETISDLGGKFASYDAVQEKKVGDFSYFGGFDILNTVLIY